MSDWSSIEHSEQPIANVVWLDEQIHVSNMHGWRYRAWWKKYRVPTLIVGSLCVGLFMLGLCVGGQQSRILGKNVRSHKDSVSSDSQSISTAATDTTYASESEPVSSQIEVDVHGDVLHPGVYILSSTARVVDAIRHAGGLVHPGDRTLINEAQPLSDGQEIVVPDVAGPAMNATNTVNTNVGPSGAVSVNTPSESISHGDDGSDVSSSGQSLGTIDLNTADEATLQTIPGIGPKRAAKIISYRETHGPFHSMNDLRNIQGFGQVTVSRMSAYVIVMNTGPN